jgi:hypothetical protein
VRIQIHTHKHHRNTRGATIHRKPSTNRRSRVRVVPTSPKLVRSVSMLSANHFVILVNGTPVLASDLIMRASALREIKDGDHENHKHARVSDNGRKFQHDKKNKKNECQQGKQISRIWESMQTLGEPRYANPSHHWHELLCMPVLQMATLFCTQDRKPAIKNAKCC